MATRARGSLAALISCLAAVALASCAVVGSAPIVEHAMLPGSTPAELDIRCQSRLGSYSLPKSLLHIKVTAPANGGVHKISIDPATKRVPENRFTFCLDHLVNAFADDTVRVMKAQPKVDVNGQASDKTTQFLQLVASRAADQSATIIRKLLLTAFTVISGNPDFEGARAGLGEGQETIQVRDLSFDPFDQYELAQINKSIAPLGFCVVLSAYSYDIAATNIDHYCNDPIGVNTRHPSPKGLIAQRQRFLVPKPRSGIFYRPRAHYPVSLYVKADPGGPDRWRLAYKKSFEFENISPIISVGVGRALFATMRTGLVFDDGTLKDVCIAKGSEAAGFVNIPLDVVYGIIALPTQTIQAQVARNTTRNELLKAQKNLIDAQTAYINYLANTDNLSAPVIPDSPDANAIKLGTGTGKVEGVPSAPASIKLPNYNAELTGDTDTFATGIDLTKICSELSKVNSGSPILDGNKGAQF